MLAHRRILNIELGLTLGNVGKAMGCWIQAVVGGWSIKLQELITNEDYKR